MVETSIERFEKAIKLEVTERPPLGHLYFGGGNWVLKELEANFNDVYYSAEGIAKAQTKAKELFGHDNVMSPWGCLTIEAEALGCKIKKTDEYPSIVKRSVASEEDVKFLRVPDPYKDGRMPLVLESLNILSKQVGEHTAVIGMVCSPFLVASEIRRLQKFLMDVLTKSDFVHEILEIVTAGCVEYAKAMSEQGIFAIMIENAYMNRTFLDPKNCKEFIFNSTKKLVDEIKKCNLYVIEHNCSKQLYIDMELELKPDILNLAVDSISKIRERVPDICLMGSVDHANTMFNGAKSDVYKEAKSCLKEGGPKGFILSTECEIPFSAPIENIKTLYDVACEGW
jgi:uroporphyrinogen decarboxylase